MSWEEYFNGTTISDFSGHDIQELLKTDVFSETEKLFINLLLEGNDPVEIAKITGYGNRHVHKSLEKIRGRLKGIKETEFVVPKKWGRIGPYKNSKTTISEEPDRP